MDNPQHHLTRRSFVRRLALIPPALFLAACGGRTLDDLLSDMASAQATPLPTESVANTVQILPPTPACGDDDDDDLTLAQTEGPFYTPNSPQRTSLLEPEITGTPLLVTGYILSTACTRIPGALVDFWHCDNAGVYDNVGYKLRGHQFTDSNGRYTLETILPGLYTGRTRHIHVKVQAPNQPILTTQLYFPGEPANAQDGIYVPELEMDVQDINDIKFGTFDFVLNA